MRLALHGHSAGPRHSGWAARLRRACQRRYIAFRIRHAENDLAWHEAELAAAPERLANQVEVDKQFIDALRTQLADAQEPRP